MRSDASVEIVNAVLRWLVCELDGTDPATTGSAADRRKRIQFFDPFVAGPNDAAPDRSVRLDRMFAETCPRFDPQPFQRLTSLAQFCMVCVSGQCGALSSGIGEVIAFLSEVLSRPCLRDRVERDPVFFPFYLQAYVALERCGRKDPAQRMVLQRFLDRGHPTAVERSVHEQMELRFWLDLGRYKHDLPAMDALFEWSPLASERAGHLLLAEPAITFRTLAFLRYWGLRPVPPLPPGRLRALRSAVAAELGMAVMARRWELTAQLLLACQWLGWEPPIVHGLASAALVRARRADGSFPGFDWSAERSRALSGTARARYDLDQNYTATLAAGLAACSGALLTPLSDSDERNAA